MSVEVVYWNPARGGSRLAALLGRRSPVNNFGDLLGPLLVENILKELGLSIEPGETASSHRLLTVGSILTMARAGDTVWGSGVNGKHLDHPHVTDGVSFRAVRGPRTRTFLQERGARVPEVFGDPGLLVSRYWPVAAVAPQDRTPLAVPNFHDIHLAQWDGFDVLDPRMPVNVCLERIARSSFVISSSLHGAIVADAYGVPNRLVRSSKEPEFKYLDHLEGTGRARESIAGSPSEALELGPHEAPCWSADELVGAFPQDLWS